MAFLMSGSFNRNHRNSLFSLFPKAERLENRLVLSADVNFVRIIDFQSQGGGELKIHYEILADPAPSVAFHFDIYRSSDEVFDDGDKYIDSSGIINASKSVSAFHSIVIDVGQGLRPDPSKPYIFAIARTSGSVSETVLSDNVASFRKYTIAVICHGGIQSSQKDIPQWEAKIGRKLQSFAYDAVIPFNWAAKSWRAGAAAKQSPRMAKRILIEAEKMPSDVAIDIDYIAHSEGTVVVTQAQKILDKVAPLKFASGYKRMSLLDPHAANPSAPNNAESTAGGLAGWLTKRIISWYKGNARDPLVEVSESVNETDVYYQRTPVSINPVNGGLYNLLGQVPVIGSARYIQLNSPGIAHSGGGGVYTWFYFNALPAFASGDKPSNPGRLNATNIRVESGGWDGLKLFTTDTSPVWSGIATPGAMIKLHVNPIEKKADNSRPVATALADAQGNWTITPERELTAGSYRVFARAIVNVGLPRPNMKLLPTIRLGRLQIPKPADLKKIRISSQIAPLSIPDSLNTNGLGLKLTDEIQKFSRKSKI